MPVAHRLSEFAVDANVLGGPFVKKDSRVGDHVRVVDGPSNLLDQFLLDVDTKTGRHIDLRYTTDNRPGSRVK